MKVEGGIVGKKEGLKGGKDAIKKHNREKDYNSSDTGTKWLNTNK